MKKLFISLDVVPRNDLHMFLSYYNKPTTGNTHATVLNLLQSGKVEYAPISISDWVIANNLSPKKNKLTPMSALDIIQSDYKELDHLAHQLTLPNTNKERIIRILGYLNLLTDNTSIFSSLPPEIVSQILIQLNKQDLLTFCNLVPNIKSICNGKYFLNVLREKVKLTTAKDVSKMNLEQLMNVSNKTLFLSENNNFIVRNNKLYGFGTDRNSSSYFGWTAHQSTFDDPIPIAFPHKVISIIDDGFINNVIDVVDSKGDLYASDPRLSIQKGLNRNNMFFPIMVGENLVEIVSYQGLKYGIREDGNVIIFHILFFDGRYSVNNIVVRDDDVVSNVLTMTVSKKKVFFITKDGEVYLDDKQSSQPGLVKFDIEEVIQVASTDDCIFFLKRNGTVFILGENKYKFTIEGDDETVPRMIIDIPRIVSIKSTEDDLMFLTEDGELIVVGDELFLIENLKENNIIMNEHHIPIFDQNEGGYPPIVEIASGPDTFLVKNNKDEVFHIYKNQKLTITDLRFT